MIAREEARLRAWFQRILVASLAATAGCSASESEAPDASAPQGRGSDPGAAGDASTADATLGSGADAGGGADAATSDVASGDDAGGDDATDAGATCADGSAEFLDGADDGSGCDLFYRLSCGLPPDSAVEDCYLLLTECATICQTNVNCRVVECDDAGMQVDAGPLTIECGTFKIGCGGVGRRPAGLVDAPPRATDGVGAWLAECARLEAASVRAFERLASELATMRAPRPLSAGARRSARDEVRHARVMGSLARRRGATPAAVTVRGTRARRSRAAFAIENAVEGCVRETFGALIASRQARAARGPELRRAMEGIARDETRHAALAWAIARWLEPRLDEATRRRLRTAQDRALAELRRESAAIDPCIARELGLPRGDEAASLVDAFAGAVASLRSS